MDSSDAGRFVNCEPSPWNEPENEPLNSLAVTLSVTNKELSILTEPVNCEPLCSDITLNPKFGLTDAVTEPDAIWLISNERADCGISNKPLPLPLKNEPESA